MCVSDYENKKKCKEENIQLFMLVTWREGKVKSEVRLEGGGKEKKERDNKKME